MRLFIALTPAIVVLVSLCGSPVPLPGSPTPTITRSSTATASRAPTATASPVASATTAAAALPDCSIDQLVIAYVGPNAADGEAYSSFGITNTSPTACRLSGPPMLIFRAIDGSAIPVPYGKSEPACNGNNGPGCLAVLIGLPAQGPTLRPLGTPPQDDPLGQVFVTVTGTFANRLATCAVPTPATLGLEFPGIDGELDVPLDAGYAPQTCWTDVRLHDYGPLEEFEGS